MLSWRKTAVGGGCPNWVHSFSFQNEGNRSTNWPKLSVVAVYKWPQVLTLLARPLALVSAQSPGCLGGGFWPSRASLIISNCLPLLISCSTELLNREETIAIYSNISIMYGYKHSMVSLAEENSHSSKKTNSRFLTCHLRLSVWEFI